MGNVEGAAQAIADALAPTQQPPSARWRWGTVVSVQDDGTITATVGGTTVSGIRAAQHCTGAKVGDRVRVAYLGTDAMVDAVRATAKLMSLPTIDGALTATGRITGAGLTSTNGAQIYGWTDLRSTNVSLASLPASGETAGNGSFSFYDNDGTYLGTVYPIVAANGNIGLSFQVRRTVNGTNRYNWLRLYLDSSGNPIVSLYNNASKTAFQNALGATSLVITRSKIVTVPANTMSLGVAADTVSGYTFLGWLQPASNGHVTSGYMENPTASATKLWMVGTRSSASDYRVTALYVKS